MNSNNSLKRLHYKTGGSAYCLLLVLFVSVFLLGKIRDVAAYSIVLTDTAGDRIYIQKQPKRVVSLVPVITEMLYAIGAEDAVKGHTYHNSYPHEGSEKIVGGFFSPSIKSIEKIQPDIIFLSDLHGSVSEHFAGKAQLFQFKANSIDDAMQNIITLGKMFEREKAASDIVQKSRDALELISKKVAKIPAENRKRVIRFMGSGKDQVMTPGDDSFQNDFIRAAGGISPQFEKEGNVVSISQEEWQRFNPQIVYVCGGKEKAFDALSQPGWNEVDAVKNKQIFSFPCDFTCRAGTQIGPFVSWLSARIYRDEYSQKEQQIYKDQVVAKHDLEIDLEYIKKAQIVSSRIYDFINKTLVIDFFQPQNILSTLEGEREGITTVGNHYLPSPSQGLGHEQGLAALRSQTYGVVGRKPEVSSFLFTGADMDNLSIQKQVFRDMEVYALVTAGVKSNAMRMAKDKGNFYEPGTINVLLFTNMQLSPRAMTRAIVSATEAKTAALADLDIRSSYTPDKHQATGTGTDNVLVVQGRGVSIDNSGGHTKMGELIAKTVYAGVQEAIAKQSSITVDRSVFVRLKERDISFWNVLPEKFDGCGLTKSKLISAIEEVLLDPMYADFIAASLSLSDVEQGALFTDLRAYGMWCKEIVASLSNKEIESWQHHIEADKLPPVIALALEALINGVCLRDQ